MMLSAIAVSTVPHLIFIRSHSNSTENRVPIDSHHMLVPGTRLTKAYDVTIPRCRNSHAKYKTVKCMFAVYWFKILCEISKVPFEI